MGNVYKLVFVSAAIVVAAALCLPLRVSQTAGMGVEASPTATPTSVGPTWQPAGFGGAGNFTGVFFDPHISGTVYAASDVAGIFRSSDGGDHWQMRSVGLGNYEVSSFAVDPFDSNTLYAGAGAISTSNKAGIYVSHDAGLTWQHLPATFTNTITFRRWRTVSTIAPDPAHQGVILSGSRQNGIWRSADSGQTWTQVYTAPLTSAPLFHQYDDDPPDPHPAPVLHVVFHPVVSSTVYAALDGFGVIRSTDSGLSWQTITSGLPLSPTVKYLAVGNSDVLYAAVGTAGVYKSTNGGTSWQPANGSLPLADPATATYNDPWVSSVAVHPTNPAIAYLTLVTYDYPSVWKTTDGGTTWVAKGDVVYDAVNDPTEAWANQPTLSWQVTLDRTNPNRLFFVSYWDIYRSDDGGEHWATKIIGAQNTCVTGLVVDTGQSDTLYATHMDAGLLSSTNQGTTWTVFPQTRDPALAGHYWRFAIARVGGTKYYYTTSDPWDQNYGQVLRSTDGVNWQPVFQRTRPAGQFMGGAMLGLAVDPSQPSTLYVTQDGGQVWKSTNNGNSWAPTTGQPEGNSFTYALAVDEAGRVFAGTLTDGVWRSTNGGASWGRVLSQQSTIFHVLAVPGAVYASAGDANLYRSADGGDTWQRLTNFTSVDDGDGVGDQGMAIAVDSNNPAHILFSRSDTWHSADAGPGIVESTDGGVSWALLNTGLGLRNVSALAVGPDGTLFAGTWCGGIWRLPAGMATPTPTPTHTPVATASNTPTRVGASPTPTATPTIARALRLPLVLKSYVPPTTPTRTATVGATPTHTPTPTPTPTATPTATPGRIWGPALNTGWQWQLTGTVDQSFDVVMYDIDMFDNSAAVVAALHAQGRKVVCYISVGSWENWRPDADQFPAGVIGNDYAGWPGEKWLDIRRIDLLGPIMRDRMDQCKAKGFDALEPDNIDGYTNDTGFPLTYQDQLNYNLWLANEAHARGLSIGLKNDPDQVADLLPYFDWALTEDCFYDGWCDQVVPFVTAGKAVFVTEYTDTGITMDQFCPQANAMNFNAIFKNRDLDAWRQACR